MLLNIANKKRLQEYVSATTKKLVMLKDLHNLGSTREKPDLKQGTEILEKQPGGTTKVLVDQDNTLVAVYYQSERMKTLFRRYPEIIFISSTHKTNNERMPLYLMVLEDGNGESEIVAVCLVARETAAIFEELLTIFKEENPMGRHKNCCDRQRFC
jgi:hypothetical protein